MEIDPVLTARFDGIGAAVRLGTTSLRVRFQVVSGGGAVTCVSVEGTALAHQRLLNPYRPGGVVVDRATLDRLADGAELRVSIG